MHPPEYAPPSVDKLDEGVLCLFFPVSRSILLPLTVFLSLSSTPSLPPVCVCVRVCVCVEREKEREREREREQIKEFKEF